MAAQLHLTIDALTLQLLLERPQRLVDIIVANDDLHKKPSNSLQKPARNPPGDPGAKAGTSGFNFAGQ
jgi:hypothetical protein